MTADRVELDPRSPLVRLAKFFDEGEFTAITPIDDSGVLAAVGTAGGVHCVAFCTDPTVQGGAMGSSWMPGNSHGLRPRSG